MTRLILIRHGETDWNVEGRYQGQADPPLNEHGREQAQKLAADLRDAGLDILYSSPLRRARETAQALEGCLGLSVRFDGRLMEVSQGDWEGRRRGRIEQLYPELLRRWEVDPWSASPPGGETLLEVQARVNAALDEILARHPGRCVGVVTHRLPIMLIKLRYRGLSSEAAQTLHLPNAYWEEIPITDTGSTDRFALTGVVT